MDKNKILIELYLPEYEREFDIFIPINKRIGTIKTIIEKILEESIGYEIKDDTNLYSKDTGLEYNTQLLVKDTDLKNASKVILV